MSLDFLIDAIGWVGALAVLVAYALVSAKKLEGNAPAYQLLNLAGGAFLIANTIYYGAYPSTIVNAVWVGIAIYTLTRHRKADPGAKLPSPEKRIE